MPCASAWAYLAPRLRPRNRSFGLALNDLLAVERAGGATVSTISPIIRWLEESRLHDVDGDTHAERDGFGLAVGFPFDHKTVFPRLTGYLPTSRAR